MAKVMFVVEDLPEGDADIIQIDVRCDTEIDDKNLTPAQEMAAILMGLVEAIREEATNDSVSKVQDQD